MIVAFSLIYFASFCLANTCPIPLGCRYQTISVLGFIGGNERTSYKAKSLRCQIDNAEFEFSLGSNTSILLAERSCYAQTPIELRWSPRSDQILSSRLQISNLYAYMLPYSNNFLTFVNLKGFQIRLPNKDTIENFYVINVINIINSDFEFFHNNQLIRTCQDVTSLFDDYPPVRSIMQMPYRTVNLINTRFPRPMCPLMFASSYIEWLTIHKLANTFYAKNVLEFSNDTSFDLPMSQIFAVQILKAQRIDLDLHMLKPEIFNLLQSISIDGFVNKVSDDLFERLVRVRNLELQITHFRKLVHTNGIGWIKGINSQLPRVDQINETRIDALFDRVFYIQLNCKIFFQQERFPHLFPDHDFCLYHDFPFSQLVFLIVFCGVQEYDLMHTEETTCTYMWLARYFKAYKNVFWTKIWTAYQPGLPNLSREMFEIVTRFLVASRNKSRSSCHFEKRLELCQNKSQRDPTTDDTTWWSKSDLIMLNQRLRSAFKITLYVIAMLGMFTNSLVLAVVWHKKNRDLFASFKQYSYLSANSLFNMIILAIELLSWITECFYPHDVFCPRVRETVAVQFYRRVFKECLVTVLRFMCNFAYMGFAFNRIALIGKDHTKLVVFMTTIGIWKYLSVAFVGSAVLATIKYFKYQINYDRIEDNFPISNEMGIFTKLVLATPDSPSLPSFSYLEDAYHIINSISDLVNYVVFMVVCVLIDVFTLRKLRQVFTTKTQKNRTILNMNPKQAETQKKEFDEAFKKAVRLVVVNTTIGILFKLPLCIMPIVNVKAEFYYQNLKANIRDHPLFGEFYSTLYQTSLYQSIQDLSDLLYSFSISIPIFIYYKFDKNFSLGVNQLCRSSNDKKSSKLVRK